MAFWAKRFSRENAPTRIYHPAHGSAGVIRKPIFRRPHAEKGVLKGVSRRVVVVKPADQSVFEEAIFIVRTDYIGRNGGPDALREAQIAAGAYLQSTLGGGRRAPIPPLIIWIGVFSTILISAALLILFC